MATTNDILRDALYAGAKATDEIVPGQGKHIRKFADELYPESPTKLSTSELAEFTPSNLIAFEHLVAEGKRRQSIPPAWLCTDESAKRDARAAVLEKLQGACASYATLTDGALDDLVCAVAGDERTTRRIEEWKALELALKKAREDDHNPRGFFLPEEIILQGSNS